MIIICIHISTTSTWMIQMAIWPRHIWRTYQWRPDQCTEEIPHVENPGVSCIIRGCLNPSEFRNCYVFLAFKSLNQLIQIVFINLIPNDCKTKDLDLKTSKPNKYVTRHFDHHSCVKTWQGFWCISLNVYGTTPNNSHASVNHQNRLGKQM